MNGFLSIVALAALLAAPGAGQAQNSGSAKTSAARQENTSGQSAKKAASHDHASDDGRADRVSLEQLGFSLGHDHHHHHGDGNGPMSAEESARNREMNSLTKEKLQSLANFLQALLEGESYPAAVKKAGVPVTDLDRLSFLPERYYPARAAALDIEAELASLKALPKAEKVSEARLRNSSIRKLEAKIAAHERFRGQFFKQINAENRALVDQFEPVFVDIVRKRNAQLKKQQEEARAEAVREYSSKSIPGLIAYLNAKGAFKSEAEAVAASGLSEKVIIGLSDLASKYLIQKRAASEAAAEIPKVKARGDEKKKAGKSAAFEIRLVQELQSRIDGFAAFQKKFAEENGAALQKDLETQYEALNAAYMSHVKSSPDGGTGH